MAAIDQRLMKAHVGVVGAFDTKQLVLFSSRGKINAMHRPTSLLNGESGCTRQTISIIDILSKTTRTLVHT